MKIAVCIKQVPVVAAMKFDAASKTIVREGVPTEVSAFDVRALLRAVELCDLHGGEVVVVTMGPPQAVEALAECLALGGDRAIHLCDRAFAASDTLATARALVRALRRERFDVILCGRNSVDAETGQVGPEIAELLDLPLVVGASSLAVDLERAVVVAQRETDGAVETVEASMPVVVTAGEDLAGERFTTAAEREAAKAAPIEELSAGDLAADTTQFGGPGSPTWVSGLAVAEDDRRRRVFSGEDIDADVDAVVGELLAAGLFDEWKVNLKAPKIASPPVGKGRHGKSTLVVAEILDGTVRGVTVELIGKARQIADEQGGTVDVLVAGAAVAERAEELVASGADRVLVCQADGLAMSAEPHAAILCEVIRRESPGLVLIGATSFGRELAPRVAGQLGLGLTGECIDLTVDEEGRVLQHKPAFGGSVVALIASRTSPEMATVRPGMLAVGTGGAARRARLVAVEAPELRDRVRVIGRVSDAGEVSDLEGAEVVVGFGKGIGGREHLPLVRELAEVVGGVLCTTRDVTDADWVPKQYQVGMTGRAIAPRIYIAVALRGAFEHMVGTRRAGLIVGVNRSRKSPLMKHCDLGLVGDWAVVVPKLIEKLRAAKAKMR